MNELILLAYFLKKAMEEKEDDRQKLQWYGKLMLMLSHLIELNEQM